MSDDANDRVANAIASHVWAIASYIREATDDPVRQGKMAHNVGEAVLLSIQYQVLPGEQGGDAVRSGE